MKIDKVNANAGLKIANPFKTSRTSTTNPFKYQDFEGNDISFKGNTLQYADVFEGYKPSMKGVNKMKMVTSSVIGSVTKIHSTVTESIANFAKGVAKHLSSAWEYAKNKDITDLPGIKSVKKHYENSILSKDIVEIGKDITHSISDASSKIKMPELNLGLTDGIHELWSGVVNKLSRKKVSPETPVAEIRTMWENIIANDNAELGKKVA